MKTTKTRNFGRIKAYGPSPPDTRTRHGATNDRDRTPSRSTAGARFAIFTSAASRKPQAASNPRNGAMPTSAENLRLAACGLRLSLLDPIVDPLRRRVQGLLGRL